MKRTIGPIGLLFVSVSSIIGSGWLFTSFYSAKLAGPAVIISWLIAVIAVVGIAMVFGEICALFPVSGSSTRIPLFTHGMLASFIFSWMIWLVYMALAPAEVQAVLQYANFYFPSLIAKNGGLSSNGYVAATFLMLLASTINFYSVRWLIKINSLITSLKIIIPLIIAGVLISLHFFEPETENITRDGIMPMGLHGIFYAISLGGIIFSFNGFKVGAEMAGEAKNPGFSVPFALIGSIVLCSVIFILLQLGFLSALSPDNVKLGWDKMKLLGNESPFASQLYQHKLNFMLPVLYVGAISAPLAAAFMYICSGSRSLYGISSCGQLPDFLKKLNTFGNPGYAIIINSAAGMLMFAPLPGWDKMAAFLTSLIALTYAIAPINLLTLRYQLPDVKRSFRLPFAHVWTAFAFYTCNLLVYWSGWDTISKLSVAIGIGLVVLSLDILVKNRFKSHIMHFDFYSSLWIWPYFIGLSIISYLGNFGGGRGIITFGPDFAIIAIFSVIVLWAAVKFRLSSTETYFYINKNIKGFAEGKME